MPFSDADDRHVHAQVGETIRATRAGADKPYATSHDDRLRIKTYTKRFGRQPSH